MKKRIISIFSIVFILLTSILSISASANGEMPDVDLDSITREDIAYTILPMGNGEINYYLYINENSQNNIFYQATNYPIRGYKESANIIVSVPDEIRQDGGIMTHYISNYSTNGFTGTRQVAMLDGTQLYIATFGTNSDEHRVGFVQFDIRGNVVSLVYIGESFTNGQDIAVFMASDGTLGYWIYDLNTGNILDVGWIYNVSMYGFLFSADYGTNEEAYHEGYLEGRSDGYNIGYDAGVRSINRDYIYQEGYDDGYASGIEVNYADTDLYQLGYAHGQDTNGIVENAITGFFESFAEFFAPFMSIGVGNLNVRTLLGFMCFALIIVAILKIVRG